MSRNGSGVYTLPAGNPVVSGTTITSSWANNTMNDIASALTGSLAADGQTPATGNLNMANNRIISVANPFNAQDAATKAYADALIAGGSAGVFTNVTDSALTSGRVTYASTGGLLVDSANLTFNGTTLTSGGFTTTGTTSTGALTATGAITINTTTNNQSYTTTGAGVITISSGTAGTINNMSIGGSTAAAGAFTTLSASGAFSANGGATLGDASGDALTINSSAVSIPNGLNFDSDTLVIDATNNRVGIGTSSPAQKLHVASSSSTYIQVQNTGNSVNAYYGVDTAGGWMGTSTNHYAAFYTNNTERMRISSGGDVGIGTNSPAAKVDVVGAVRVTNTSNSANYGQLSDGGGLVITSANNNPMYFNVGGSERMRIDSSGNVMVNTTSSSGKFTCAATGSTISAYFTAVNNHGLYAEATGTGYGIYGRAYNAAYGGVIGYDSNNTVYGILGIGGYGLSTNASINVNGTIYTSDGRLKENVKPINNALETITKLNPVSFDWKADSAKGVTNKNTPLPDYGMIAQEVEKVLPDIVYETKTPARPKEAENTKTLEDDLGLYKGVDYSRLIPFLTKAIQEQQAMIEELKTKVTALESK